MNRKKISLYILFAFSFSWTVALFMLLSHVSVSSLTGIILLAGLYMPGPAVATFIVQKLIYREGLNSAVGPWKKTVQVCFVYTAHFSCPDNADICNYWTVG